jgi:hypothetical protein
MRGRPKAIITGFGREPPRLVFLRLPSADITEGGSKRSLGTELFHLSIFVVCGAVRNTTNLFVILE